MNESLTNNNSESIENMKIKSIKSKLKWIIIFLIILILILINNLSSMITIKKHSKSESESENQEKENQENEFEINFLGDDLTFGISATGLGIGNFPADGYTHLVEKLIKGKSNNFGNRLSTITKLNNNELDFTSRVYDLYNTANFTFVLGGVNDYSNINIKPGNLNSSDSYTFYGAINIIIKRLLQTWDNNHICFILPIPRFNETFNYSIGDLNSVRKNIKSICDNYNIDTLDITNNISIPIIDQPSEYFIDGVFLNENGHSILANEITRYLKNKNFIK